ncbi:MAG TPA: pyruvate kinase alpha/beta domain-containing protein [Thermodesulfovibrionales bacterium]|nr:pyruvate kinase alpha/beta domain-containing protein [Thermodesulfovibrionales bacterium]
MEKTVVYFEKPGKDNSPACLDIVRKAIAEEGYKHIVVASTTGDTAILFSEALRALGINLVVVTHATGYKEPNAMEMPLAIRKRVEQNGAVVFTGSMLTHSIETAFAAKFSGLYPTLIVANTLRRLGEGLKVGCEIVMMAVDAGLIPEGEEVLAVAGTARGADTVLIIKSSASKRFFDLKVLEILAKPRS